MKSIHICMCMCECAYAWDALAILRAFYLPFHLPMSKNLHLEGAPKSLQMVIAAMKLKDAYSLEGKLWPN